MMTGQEDILNNLSGKEESTEVGSSEEESIEEESTEVESTEDESTEVESSEEESTENESIVEGSDEEELSETQVITLSMDDIGFNQSLDSLGLIGITCIVIIYLLGILVILKRRD